MASESELRDRFHEGTLPSGQIDVQAVLRRAYDYEASTKSRFCGAEFDAGASCLLAGGARRELTKNESRILAALLERRGSIVSREELMLRLWDSDKFVDDNTLTVNINRLRRKLESIGAADYLATKRGQGYRI